MLLMILTIRPGIQKVLLRIAIHGFLESSHDSKTTSYDSQHPLDDSPAANVGFVG